MITKKAFLLFAAIVAIISAMFVSSAEPFCSPVQAAEMKAGNAVSVGSSQVIEDDLYITGGSVAINGRVNGDLIVAGGTVVVNGSVRDDVIAAGGNINLNGPVGQTVRVAAGNAVINSDVGHDLVMAGGTLDLSDGATIKNDVLMTGGTANLSGNIGRDLNGSAGMLTIGGTINGDSTLTVSQLTLSNGSNIKGNLTYTSQNKAKIESGAAVSGKITQKQPPVTYKKPSPGERAAAILISFLFSLIAAYIFGAVLLLMFPARTGDIANTVLKSPWPSLGLGFLALIVVPIAVFILMFFIVTIPISITILFFYVLGLYLAKIFVGLAVGRWIFGRFKWQSNDFLALLIGLFSVMLLASIPVVGWLVRFIYVLLGLGAAAMSIYRLVESGRKTEPLAESTEKTENEKAAPAENQATEETGHE